MSAAVRHVYAGRWRDHYAVGSDRKTAVTVRVGADNIYCCLTCRSVECNHARAAESAVKSGTAEPIPTQEAANAT